MEFTDEKLAVFRQLKQETNPASLKKILNKLGSDFKERSVRRWLAEMVKEGLVEKIGHRRATTYKVTQTIEHQSPSYCFSAKSLPAVALIRRPIYERPPVAYSDEWFHAYEPNQTYYIPEQIRTQLYLAGKRSQEKEPEGTYAHHIFNRLLIDLSYNSSRLEGNTYSLLDTQKLLLEGKSVEGKLDEETVMILNHKEAIRYLVDQTPKIDLSFQTFCTFHYLLADGLLEAPFVGKVRPHGVRIGGSTYIPYENAMLLKERLHQIARKASLIKDPYEQSFFLLVHISYLQAFVDVNKRTARLVANIPLVKQNLVPLSFNDVEREDYISAILAVYELQDIQPLIDIYAFSYLRTCAMYDSTIKALGFDEVRVRYRTQRRDMIREIILQKPPIESLKQYVFSQTTQKIPQKDQAAFIKDLDEDLEQIDESRIVGLGITLTELQNWKNLYHKNTSD
ncbi:MAG: Fic family protein [Methylococcales bacterium]|nr:Fic family protein [Methylococcales bacterium]